MLGCLVSEDGGSLLAFEKGRREGHVLLVWVHDGLLLVLRLELILILPDGLRLYDVVLHEDFLHLVAVCIHAVHGILRHEVLLFKKPLLLLSHIPICIIVQIIKLTQLYLHFFSNDWIF